MTDVVDINAKRGAAKKRAASSSKRASSPAKKTTAKKTATKAPAKKRSSTAAAAAKSPTPEISNAVNTLLKSLELDEAGDAYAAIARRLAAELDGSYFVVLIGDDDYEGDLPVRIGADGKAIPALAKELRDVLDSIQNSSAGEGDEFVAGLFSEVGD